MADPAEIAQEDLNTRCHKTWISGQISGISFPLLMMRENGAEDPIPGQSVIFMVGTRTITASFDSLVLTVPVMDKQPY